MQNSKLIMFLRSLNNSEFREFKDFIISPVFNKNKNIVSLFDAVKKYYPGFNHSEQKNELIFRKVFPEIEFD